MTLPVLLFPDTVLRRSTLLSLCPLCRPVCLLVPPSLAAKAEPKVGPPLVEVLRPELGTGADGAGDDEPRRMAALLRQWEQWVRETQGTGLADALKAGVLPEPPETVHTVMSELKHYGQSPAGRRQTPEVGADLMLHLAHIHDSQAAELEEALQNYENGKRKLSDSMGRNEADHDPADYEDADLEELPPVDYSQNIDHLLDRRLSAWSILEATMDDQRWLATTHAAAVDMLAARANAPLGNGGAELRSAAGAVAPFDDIPPEAGSALVQTVAEVMLPVPSVSGMEALEALDAQLLAALEPVRLGLDQALRALAQGPWGAEAVNDAAAKVDEAAAAYAAALESAKAASNGQVRLRVVAFPGLGRAQMLDLMRDGGTAPGADKRGGGAWPLLVFC